MTLRQLKNIIGILKKLRFSEMLQRRKWQWLFTFSKGKGKR